jgi:hypothetical protein
MALSKYVLVLSRSGGSSQWCRLRIAVPLHNQLHAQQAKADECQVGRPLIDCLFLGSSQTGCSQARQLKTQRARAPALQCRIS